jgi:hypothetical protein
LSTDSRSAPPEAPLCGVIVKLESAVERESTTVAVATKLFALFAAVPFVDR